MIIELDGEWLGFEDILAQAAEENTPPVVEEPPPDRTYEQHLVLEDF